MIIDTDPLVDFACKRMLGNPEHPAITVHFLNAVLCPVEPIVSVEFLNPFIGQEFESDKLVILDILARDTVGDDSATSHLGEDQRLAWQTEWNRHAGTVVTENGVIELGMDGLRYFRHDLQDQFLTASWERKIPATDAALDAGISWPDEWPWQPAHDADRFAARPSRRPASFVETDADEDGVRDFVLGNGIHPSLLCLSGRDGRTLWLGPGLALYPMIRLRRWSLGSLFVLPIVVGWMLVVARTSFRLHPTVDAPNRWLVGLAAIPLLLVLGAIVQDAWRRRPRRIAAWVATIVGLSLTIALLWVAVEPREAEERFRLEGWWQVGLWGTYATGLFWLTGQVAILLREMATSTGRIVRFRT